MSKAHKKNLRIGQIVAAHGIRGEVKIEPDPDFLELFEAGNVLTLNGQELTVQGCRAQHSRLLVKFKEISDRNQAEKLQWAYLESSSASPRALEENEYLTSDLEGMRVVSEDGEVLGEVEEILPYPAQHVLVVGDILIPVVKDFIREVDLRGRRIVVRLIEGMRP